MVSPKGTLIAGHRRLEAVRRLGWTEIDVTTLDVADLLRAERDENTERKDFTPTEAVEIGRMIEAREKPQALERMGTKATPANLAEVGDVRDVAARAVGMSHATYEHAKAVVEAAEREPERFGDLPEKMDASGQVNGAYRTLRARGGAPQSRTSIVTTARCAPNNSARAARSQSQASA